jgi:5-hydroxyisourate hydrolase
MGLSTHVLDTMHGVPAGGMKVSLFTTQAGPATLVKAFTLNSDLVFEVAAYFKARGVTLPEPAFLDQVSLDFGVADTSAHYHVPLLVSPWSYSTYRGS